MRKREKNRGYSNHCIRQSIIIAFVLVVILLVGCTPNASKIDPSQTTESEQTTEFQKETVPTTEASVSQTETMETGDNPEAIESEETPKTTEREEKPVANEQEETPETTEAGENTEVPEPTENRQKLELDRDVPDDVEDEVPCTTLPSATTEEESTEPEEGSDEYNGPNNLITDRD